MARVTLTDDIIGELERLKRETGLGPMKLLARSDNVPQGLNSAIINTWLNRKTESARAEHLEFVFAAYRDVPPVIPITGELQDQLNQELARTGYTPTSLLNALRPFPPALDARLISRWSTGRTRSAKGDLWCFVMDGLKVLPDAK